MVCLELFMYRGGRKRPHNAGIKIVGLSAGKTQRCKSNPTFCGRRFIPACNALKAVTGNFRHLIYKSMIPFNHSRRALGCAESTRPLPAHRLHRLTGRRGGQGGQKLNQSKIPIFVLTTAGTLAFMTLGFHIHS